VKLGISNIAWPAEREAEVAKLLQRLGVAGVEIAPTKIWPAPLEATAEEITGYRRFWEERGIRLVAAQALLFGKPELTLFEAEDVRARTLDYLAGIARVCGALGTHALVFGSPKNRRVGSLPREEAWEIAVSFFRKLAEAAASAGTTVVMEANPREYGTDFITRAADAIDLVRAVSHPGFRLHLDTACMSLAGDPIADTITAADGILAHFHVSEPFLAPVLGSKIPHADYARALRRRGYAGWVSIEMRQQDAFAPQELADTINFVRAAYSI
jgi:sugar phosphate isomerase/epimerase